MLPKSVFHRPIEWNGRRYPRVFDKELVFELLEEEFSEYIRSRTLLDEVDALGDIFFICAGNMWKLPLEDEVYTFMHKHYLLALSYTELIPEEINTLGAAKGQLFHALDRNEEPADVAMVLGSIIELVLAQFKRLGFTKEQVIQVLHIICDSNDTKRIDYLKTSEKGNLKGALYFAPTKRLKLLLEEVNTNET